MKKLRVCAVWLLKLPKVLAGIAIVSILLTIASTTIAIYVVGHPLSPETQQEIITALHNGEVTLVITLFVTIVGGVAYATRNLQLEVLTFVILPGMLLMVIFDKLPPHFYKSWMMSQNLPSLEIARGNFGICIFIILLGCISMVAFKRAYILQTRQEHKSD